MTEDRGLTRVILNPNLNLTSRTWLLIAETRDLKIGAPAHHPVSPCSLIFLTANRQPLNANTYHG
jgi:hypothetical protein